MGLQLIYTSAPKLLQGGRTGFGTVAMHPQIRPALREKLEQISKFSRVDGLDPQRVVFYHRTLSAGGEEYSVLSRILDAGVDYTGRTNHIAHHLVFSAQEVLTLASRGVTPADVAVWASDQRVWRDSWPEQAQELTPDSEIDASAISASFHLPATHWQELLGESARATALAPGTLAESCWILYPESLRSNLLGLLGEAMLLHAAPWSLSFATDFQPVDQSTEVRWRCVCHGSPVCTEARQSVRPILDLARPDDLPVDPSFVFLAEQGHIQPAEPEPSGILGEGASDRLPHQGSADGNGIRVPTAGPSSPLQAGPSLRSLKARQKHPNSNQKSKRRVLLPLLAALVGVTLILGGLWAWERKSQIDSVLEEVNGFSSDWQFEGTNLTASDIWNLSHDELKSLTEVTEDRGTIFTSSNKNIERRESVSKLQSSIPKSTGENKSQLDKFLAKLETLLDSAEAHFQAQEHIEEGDFDEAEKEYDKYQKILSQPKLAKKISQLPDDYFLDWKLLKESKDIRDVVEQIKAILPKYANKPVEDRPTKAHNTLDNFLVEKLKEVTPKDNPAKLLKSLPTASQEHFPIYDRFVAAIRAKESATSESRRDNSNAAAPDQSVAPSRQISIEWVKRKDMIDRAIKESEKGNNGFQKIATLSEEQIVILLSGGDVNAEPAATRQVDDESLPEAKGLAFDNKGVRHFLLDVEWLKSKRKPALEIVATGGLSAKYDKKEHNLIIPGDTVLRLFAKVDDDEEKEVVIINNIGRTDSNSLHSSYKEAIKPPQNNTHELQIARGELPMTLATKDTETAISRIEAEIAKLLGEMNMLADEHSSNWEKASSSKLNLATLDSSPEQLIIDGLLKMLKEELDAHIKPLRKGALWDENEVWKKKRQSIEAIIYDLKELQKQTNRSATLNDKKKKILGSLKFLKDSGIPAKNGEVSHEDAEHALLYFLDQYPKEKGAIEEKKAELTSRKDIEEKSIVFDQNPLKFLEIALYLGDAPVLIYKLNPEQTSP